MQFHLDGFRAGDPGVSDRSPQALTRSDGVPAEVDVLIVGCGPAGLTLAAQLARFPEIRTAIVEQKEGPLQLGQADGIACRTMEMFEAMGFADRVLAEGCWINEVTFWRPDPADPARIVRHGRVQDTADGLSEFPHVVLSQARIHDFYLDSMARSASGLEPHYGRKLLDLDVDASGGARHPVTVRLERTGAGHAGEVETVRARYVVGCDGARSAVRKSIGVPLVGDSANQAWGVMDLLCVTDYPDIRYKSAIQAADGNLIVIPREGGYLVRFYVRMEKLGKDERVAQRGLELDDVVAAARRILHPYTLDVKEVPWWSVYEIGQRIAPKYDDVPAGAEGTRSPHVFIAGDACHTHSPKAGQGMNFSMQDTFNLGWKLAAVLRGLAPEALLHSYSAERQPAAQELLDFDREWSKMVSDAARVGEGEGVDPKALQTYFEQHGRFTAGLGTHYPPSTLTGGAAHQALATGFAVGERFHSAPVIRQSDARPLQLGHVARADGRWRLYAFAGADDVEDEDEAGGIGALCRFLDTSPDSPLRRHTPGRLDVDAVFDLRAVFQQSHRELASVSWPALLRPAKGRLRLHDFEKVFCADPRADIFELRGIDRTRGALVVVRPDQYVAQVLPLDAHAELAAFFAGFMQAH